MELLEKEMHVLFPTALFTGKVSDYSLCDRAEKKLLEMRQAGIGARDEDGVYITPDDIQRLPEFQELSTLILAEANEILNVYGSKETRTTSPICGRISRIPIIGITCTSIRIAC